MCLASHRRFPVRFRVRYSDRTPFSLLVMFVAHRNLYLTTTGTRWFKYDRDKLWLVYTQIDPVIFEPPCILWCNKLLLTRLIFVPRYDTVAIVYELLVLWFSGVLLIRVFCSHWRWNRWRVLAVGVDLCNMELFIGVWCELWDCLQEQTASESTKVDCAKAHKLHIVFQVIFR
jgi:hypothetical protein